ncbi:MAG: tol-pal system protein YbgF [Thermodesulfovibrionales bacterium]
MQRKLKAQNSKLKYVTYCLLIFSIFLLFGCASLSDFEALRNDVNQLRRDTYEIKRDVNDLKTKTEDVIKEQDFKAFRESQAEIHSRVSEISKELQFLSGKFDEGKYSVEKLQKDSASELSLLKAELTNISGQVKDIKERLNTLEARSKEAEKRLEESKKEPSEPSSSLPKGPSVSKDKIAMYEEAYDAFKNKRYKEARDKFEAFIKEYPQDELTDNAQFWIAETYYGEKDYEGAILAYEVILKKFPKSEKTSGVLLKQGLSFNEIGDSKTAKTILEKVIEKYPNSKEAELAKKKISEIDKRTEKKKK